MHIVFQQSLTNTVDKSNRSSANTRALRLRWTEGAMTLASLS